MAKPFELSVPQRRESLLGNSPTLGSQLSSNFSYESLHLFEDCSSFKWGPDLTFLLRNKVFGSSFEMCPFGQTMVTRKDWEGADLGQELM